jgi:hypothetical protein
MSCGRPVTNSTVATSEISTPLPGVFDSLRAEREREWLHRVFVQPAFLVEIGGDRSVVVIGGEGAGKTSARLWLAQAAAEPRGYLVVDWSLPQSALLSHGLQALEQIQNDLLRVCVRSLVGYVIQNPSLYSDYPEWVKENITWFTARHTEVAGDLFFRQLRRGLQTEQTQLLEQVLKTASIADERRDVSLNETLNEFVLTIREVGLSGVWVMLDGLETWLDIDPQSLSDRLQILLSTLHLFEAPGFAIKLFAPDELENSLMASGSATRRRLDVARMRWREEELRAVAERRLASYFGVGAFALNRLGHEQALLELLRDYGGQRPLGWLQLLRPFVDEYTRQRRGKPLSEEQCLTVWRSHPPRLRVDVRRERVFVAFRQLNLESNSFRLIRYLYENRQRTCPYDELYYVGYRGYDHIIKDIDDKRHEYPKNWKHTLEMALSRLRKAIEMEPRDPVYIVTERDRGVRLQNIT